MPEALTDHCMWPLLLQWVAGSTAGNPGRNLGVRGVPSALTSPGSIGAVAPGGLGVGKDGQLWLASATESLVFSWNPASGNWTWRVVSVRLSRS